MRKKILVLGNGFDLAHGLPTKYSDFLVFAECAMAIYTYAEKPGAVKKFVDTLFLQWELSAPSTSARIFLKEKLCALFKNMVEKAMSVADNPCEKMTSFSANDRWDLFHDYLEKNIWYEYIKTLFAKEKTRGENWIDFESEISFIIERLDNDSNMSTHYLDNFQKRYNDDETIDDFKEKINLFVKACGRCCIGNEYNAIRTLTLDALREKLYGDLEKFILAFEIYLTDIIYDIPIDNTILAIKKIDPDFIISFNYTDTYERYYMNEKTREQRKVCHIHGTCVKNRNPEENDMVLGIDEYLPEEQRTKRVDYCLFKKFVQRIRKHNDVSYASWANEVEKRGKETVVPLSVMDEDAILAGETDNNTDIYIYGHSLDVTDKDILQRFLISDFTYIHIFARNKVAEGKLISNLIRITDVDTIIKKSTTNPPKLEFLLSST